MIFPTYLVDFASADTIVTLSLLFLCYAAIDFAMFKTLKRVFIYIYVFTCEVLSLLFFILQFSILAIIFPIFLVAGLVVFFITNLNDCRSFIANNQKGKAPMKLFVKKEKAKPEALFDRDAVYAKIEDAVTILAKKKTGALITFERKDSLNDVMKSGTIINAPVSSELLQTIFYTGTRLHDGAVIIRNDMIVAASVYFEPTIRPLTGKFGSRHRAAIGISEVCDAVTVVVSEETGRISIAYQGELETVGPDNFLSRFEDYMAMVAPSKEE